MIGSLAEGEVYHYLESVVSERLFYFMGGSCDVVGYQVND